MLPAAPTDYREAARRALPRMLFEYIDGGAYSQHTLARNVADFSDFHIRQRVLRDVSAMKTETELLGQSLAMPLLLAPVGMAGMYARRGEVQAARAAEKAGLPFCLSTVSICGLEEVAQGTSRLPWFQLYMIKDRGRLRSLLERASALGVPALVFTVDMPVPGTRYRDTRSGFSAQPSLRQWGQRLWGGMTHPRWSWDVMLRGGPHMFGNLSDVERAGNGLGAFWSWIRANFDPSATWADIEWVRSIWKGPIILKGILDAEDARQAHAAGADGIVVSNHGGRQLDDVTSSIRALPKIADALSGAMPILVDGGIRSGLDILKALSLGADACMIGRLWAYALAAGGEPAVTHMLSLLKSELSVAMALSGCTDIRNAHRSMIEAASRAMG